MANTDIPKFITKDMLREIRDKTNWRELFLYLGLERDKKSTEKDWWSKSPLNLGEKTASFHINDHGWTCFSTNESGYVIELVQKVVEQRTGRALNCYEAGKWLLENGLSSITVGSHDSSALHGKAEGFTGNIEERRSTGEDDGKDSKDVGKPREGEEDETQKRENIPIRQTLIPSLDMGYLLGDN